ncbi:MAG TPA: hydroxyisourate hydrolase [Trebonia sp.]|jgi:5-hydroxyisourate hydrolase|nr:hydroxyisourate hydrolase [Trebonia sp.]
MTVSTHVLDTSAGHPAAGVTVSLSRWDGAAWAAADSGRTDPDGRLRFTGDTPPGQYRLTFGTGAYFAARGVATFYPEAVVTVTIPDGAHYHVPLLLAPFGYSTYRGS